VSVCYAETIPEEGILLKLNKEEKKGVIVMKRWLIISVAVAILLIVGWLFYNSTTNPPVAEVPVSPALPVVPAPVVPTPLPVVPVPPVVVTPTPPVTPVLPVIPAPPTIPPNFIVPDELWEGAFRINLADGTPLRGTIGFSYLPIGTELRAPLDGYISEGRTNFPGGESVLSLQWTERQRRPGNMGETKIAFNVAGAEVVNRSPRKGEVFARVTGNTPIGTGFYDRKVIFEIMMAPTDLDFQTDRSITDPRAYLWAAIQQLLPIK